MRTEFFAKDVGKSILILLELSLDLMVATSVSKYKNEIAPKVIANKMMPEIILLDIRGLLFFLDLNTVFFSCYISFSGLVSIGVVFHTVYIFSIGSIPKSLSPLAIMILAAFKQYTIESVFSFDSVKTLLSL